MKRLSKALAGAAIIAVLAPVVSPAFAYDYLTEGYDKGRTGWIQEQDPLLTRANMGKMKLLWKQTLPSTTRSYHNLFSPLVIEKVNTAQGVKEVAIVAGVSDQLWGLDAKTGATLWSKKFDYSLPPGDLDRVNGANRLCPGGQTAAPHVEKLANGSYKVWALSGDGRIWQVDPATGADLAPPVKFAPNDGKPYALNMDGGYVYTALSQGCGGNDFQFLAFNTATQRTSIFYPAGGGLWGRRGVAIDSKGNGWMGTGDQVFRPATGNLGNINIAVKPDAQGMLQLTGHHAAYNANWLYKRDLDVNVSPLVISHRGKEVMLTTNKDCRLHLVDAELALQRGTAGIRQTLDTSPLICNDRQVWDEKGVWGSISAAKDAQGRTWVFVPFWGEKSDEFKPRTLNTPRVPDRWVSTNQDSRHGGVAAFTISNDFKLVPQWLSQDMDMAEEGLYLNGIFWVYASGVNARQQGREIAWNDTTTAFGDPHVLGNRAVVYALDGATGRTLWSSGDQIATWNHFSGITVANGKVYVGTFDGVMYAFGVEQ